MIFTFSKSSLALCTSIFVLYYIQLVAIKYLCPATRPKIKTRYYKHITNRNIVIIIVMLLIGLEQTEKINVWSLIGYIS